MVAPCDIRPPQSWVIGSLPPPPQKNVARTPMVKCSFHQASALEVNGPPNLNVLPTPLRVKISFYNTASFIIYFVCSKKSDFCECFWNKQNITWMLGNMKFITRVRFAHSWDILFNTRNKFHISAQPCLFSIWYIIEEYIPLWQTLIRDTVLFSNFFLPSYKLRKKPSLITPFMPLIKWHF